MSSIAELNRRLSLAIEHARPPAVTACLARLDAAEIRWVQRQNRLMRRRWLRAVAVTLTRSGNGWLYLGVAALLLVLGGERGVAVMVAAGASVLVTHGVYAIGKPFVARARPFTVDSTVEAHGTPMDLYSFPSGHCMTASAVAIAVGTAFPASLPVSVLVCVLLAWARIACAHHYVSDVVGGAALGVAVGLPVSLLVLF